MNRSTRQFFAALGGVAVVLLVGPDADANVDVLVSDISVSNGYVYGNSVILPVGETLTIGTRVVDPSATLIRGLGLSYYGYDDAVLGFTSGDVVTSLFPYLCFPSVGCFSDVANMVTSAGLVESVAAPSSNAFLPGPNRVRVFRFMHRTYSGSYSAVNDIALDGQIGNSNGDAHFRLSFEGRGDGYTEIEVGTGDDLGGAVFIGTWEPVAAASNAVIRVAVPEPGVTSAIGAGCIALAWAQRRRELARR